MAMAMVRRVRRTRVVRHLESVPFHDVTQGNSDRMIVI